MSTRKFNKKEIEQYRKIFTGKTGKKFTMEENEDFEFKKNQLYFLKKESLKIFIKDFLSFESGHFGDGRYGKNIFNYANLNTDKVISTFTNMKINLIEKDLFGISNLLSKFIVRSKIQKLLLLTNNLQDIIDNQDVSEPEILNIKKVNNLVTEINILNKNIYKKYNICLINDYVSELNNLFKNNNINLIVDLNIHNKAKSFTLKRYSKQKSKISQKTKRRSMSI
mgnify:CR=1 FL=1